MNCARLIYFALTMSILIWWRCKVFLYRSSVSKLGVAMTARKLYEFFSTNCRMIAVRASLNLFWPIYRCREWTDGDSLSWSRQPRVVGTLPLQQRVKLASRRHRANASWSQWQPTALAQWRKQRSTRLSGCVRSPSLEQQSKRFSYNITGQQNRRDEHMN